MDSKALSAIDNVLKNKNQRPASNKPKDSALSDSRRKEHYQQQQQQQQHQQHSHQQPQQQHHHQQQYSSHIQEQHRSHGNREPAPRTAVGHDHSKENVERPTARPKVI